jgi:probable rRNA maturation factor
MPSLVVNLQRKQKIDTKSFRKFLETLLTKVEEAKEGEVSVAFVSDGRMKELNGFFRGKTATTDVLSFPHEPDDFSGRPHGSETQNYLGDIVISCEQAARQAEDNQLTLEIEIKQLILHGVLHLCGYDHETDNGEMNARELELRKELGIYV